jgi:5'-3' exonuclease
MLQGIGAKTAKQLVQSFGTVEQIAQQLAALSEEEQKQVGSTRADANAATHPRMCACSHGTACAARHCLGMGAFSCVVCTTAACCCCPWQVVKLNKQQRAMLLSEDGQVAAAFMKELVTINTQLKAPPCQ